MKRIAALIVAAALLPAVASAGTNASEMSVGGGLSVLIGSTALVASPFVLVGDVVEGSVKGGKTSVQVVTNKGQKENIEIPKAVADKAQLKPGDKLTVKPAKSGAVLAKDDKPIAFVMTQEGAGLTRSHELAK